MTRRKPRRPNHRPLRLMEPGLHDKLVNATKAGTPMALAARTAGIAPRTFELWCSRGHDEEAARAEGEAPDEDAEIYLKLWQDVSEARAEAAVHASATVRKSMQGGYITKEVTRKYRDVETGKVVEETTIDRAPPDWRAAAWYLEHSHPGHFSKKEQVEVSGAVGGVMLSTAQATALSERIAANVAALSESTNADTLTQIGPGRDTGDEVVYDAEIVTDDE